MAEVLLITALVLGLFFVFFVRPARREQNRRRRDLNDLRIGDEILTRGGLLATVSGVETPEDGPMILYLELADGLIVRAHTDAVAERLRTVDEIADDALDSADSAADAPAEPPRPPRDAAP